MRRDPPPLEWQTAESDAAWAELCEPPAPAPTRRLPWSVLVLLVVLAAAGGWRYAARVTAQPQAAGVPAEKRTEMHTEMHTEMRAAATPDRRLLAPAVQRAEAAQAEVWRGGAVQRRAALPGRNLQRFGQVAVHTVEIQGDDALAHVTTPAVRQTFFFHHTAAGWQPAAPNAALWGAAQVLVTDSFVFEYREKDAAVVAAVAPQVEALYTTLRQTFALARADTQEKIIVEVSLTPGPVDGVLVLETARPAQPDASGRGARLRRRITVASPAVYIVPVELSDAEVLAQAVALPLVAHVVSEIVTAYHLEREEGAHLARALRLWQLWELDLPLAGWREEVVRWRMQQLAPLDLARAPSLPARYQALCTLHGVWLASPQAIGIPLSCSALDRDPAYWTQVAGISPFQAQPRLTPALRHTRQHGVDRYWIDSSADAVALAALLEYIVQDYGRARLPAFLTAMGRHTRTNRLIAQVFGVSAAEFEAGWQAYVAARYGASSP